ncbi:MAG: multifunctional CCA tRNA nucleotidyl transferase/2'3'-cyclic phosphodiesterase/2'nucleotidase/phosphatase [Gammaproteobacteria bacterium RIFCSPLOWO2_12_FULL_52_10]|nr:MAG: multifunctional CCA tRNA nucleotidyl transferase/2'3'-cyclic phosphodiesterase/2'nucleotidase/phosphatase [Gammaproteobacteria bacterium RIFCSPLOWO2_12_FULL_52_10]
MKVYKVGGAVRDRLLGHPVQDHDWVVVGATPEAMLALGYKPVGRDFPVFLHPETHEEYALARTERKTAPGYRGFSFNTAPDVTLEDDLRRRDLTINAIAEDADGSIIDPYHGQTDLKAGILRHVSPAFTEDPLRVIRVARFAARYNFTIAPATEALLKEISQTQELAALAVERIWQETERALAERQPVRFFSVLRECGALAKVFPEIDRLFGVPQPADYHPEIDSGIHTMMVLAQACKLSTDPVVRFAALVHDLGKAATPPEEWPSHKGHEERSVDLVLPLCDRYRIPNQYRELAVIVARYHLDCHRIHEMQASTIVRKLEALDAFRRPDRFEQFLLACEADARGRTGFEDRDYPQAEFLATCLKAATNINIGELTAQGLTGKAMAEAIRLLRINAIRTIHGG